MKPQVYLNTEHEIEDWFKANGHVMIDTTPRIKVRYDMPSGNRAVVIFETLRLQLRVSAFRWNETEPIRSICKYGSNHDSRLITYSQMLDALLECSKIRKVNMIHCD